MLIPLAATLVLLSGASERLRWSVSPIEGITEPSSYLTVATAMSPDGAITGRSGSTQSIVGWHAFVWTTQDGTQQCLDTGYMISEGLAINSSHMVAGSIGVCPQQDGACAAGPVLLGLDTAPAMAGLLLTELLVVEGLTESGHMLFRQGYPNSNQVGAWLVMPNGMSVILPLPDTAFSVNLAPPITIDGVVQTVFVAGFVWASPYRMPTLWTIDVDGGVTLEVLPTAGEGGEAHRMLEDGTLLGSVRVAGVTQAVEWAQPWTSFSPLTPADDGNQYQAATLGTTTGDRAGAAWINGNQATWWRHPDASMELLTDQLLGISPSDVTPIAFLPDGSLLLQVLDLQTYESTSGSWRPDTGFLRVNQRSFGGNAVPTGQMIAGSRDGSLAFNQYPLAWSAAALAAGDANGDGSVTVDDILTILSSWGPCGVPCLDDLDGDGEVDVDDLLAVLSQLSG